ncbi:MAG TPA: DUF4331 family protein [Bryobacteraceae bacterium]|nr:DUF4331 family protein [Bryobacteraceae bacterium]
MIRKILCLLFGLLLAIVVFVAQPAAYAADHRDAPAVDGVGEGDLTDVFAFIDPSNRNKLVLILGVNPFSIPGFLQSYRFSPDFLYQFKIDRDGDAKEDAVIQMRFRNTASGQNIIVNIGTPDPAFRGTTNYLLQNAPSQVETPTETMYGTPDDLQIFAGQRDDPFVLDSQFFRILNNSQDVFRDIPSSPLGHLRGRPVRADGTSGIDLLAGLNASFIAVSIPVSWVAGENDILNIWATVSSPVEETGGYVQFEREGQGLINTVFIPAPLKDAFNQGVPSEDVARWSQFVFDALTTTDNDGTGNTIAGRANLLTSLGLTSLPFGAPLLLPATFVNTNKDLIRNAVLPDTIRLSLKADPNDLAIGQFGITNGRRTGDATVDIAFRLLRQLADVNFPAALKVPGSGNPRAGALSGTDRRLFAVLQGTQFIRPDSTLGDLTTSGNDKALPTTFPFLGTLNARPGDPGYVGFPTLGASPEDPFSSVTSKR